MTTIHDAYVTGAPAVPFTGERCDLRGGDYLGRTTQPDIWRPGDIVTGTGSAYFFDPALLIEGESYAWDGSGWRGIARGLDAADAPAPPAPPAPPKALLCRDTNEPEGTRFPCRHCLLVNNDACEFGVKEHS